MIDKVQKILSEITTRKLCTMDEHMAFYNDKAKEDYRLLSEIEELIKALQEEHVSEFLNTESMIESYKQRLISQANGVKNNPLIDMCLASYKHGINDAFDTLNLSNVQRTVKNWKEHVSEDLMDATNNYCVNVRKGYPRVKDETDRYICNAFETGAKWQEKKDQETIETAIHHAYHNGRLEMKEQMMAKVVDATLLNGNLIKQKHTTHPLHVGDKVKVIVIKED